MDLNKKLEELKPYQLNCNVFDVYSYNGLSMQDLLCQFFTKINECINVSNETIDLAKWLVNEGLEIEVVKKLMLWLEDGTLENIINVNIFNTLNEKINGLSSQLEHDINELSSQLEHNMNKSVGVINAKFPPLNFNVEGLKGGGVEGDGERLVNLISYLSNNFSFSTLEIPYDIYSIECEIVIPNNVKVYGINRPILDFKIDEGVAIYLYNNNHNIFRCIELKGKSLCSNVVALRVEGSSNTIDDIIIYKFKQGIDFARPNTYNNTFNNIFIKETQLCLYGDFVGANTVNNAGERITFKNSTFCNSNELLFFNSGILDLYFDNCSLDYCKKFINANNGRAYFNNCHIETKRDEDNCDWATTNDYLIQTNNDPHLFFTNCEFHLYNIHRIVDPTSTLGEIKYNNCQCWFTNNEGTSQYCYSEHNFFWNIHEGMIQSEYNAFVSKVTRPGCLMCCDYNNNQTPSIPKMSINVEECKLTFEFTEEQKPRENTYIKILFN